MRNIGWELTPKLGIKHRMYSLSGNSNNSITDTTPIFSLRGKMIFDKIQTTNILQTLEPEMYFLYIPASNQDNIPIFDVVSPSVEFALNNSKNKNIGIVGTLSTTESKSYTKLFNKLDKEFTVNEVPCPLFVPIIEEGWANTNIANDIAKIYLNEFNTLNIDSLILGCTHYPIMAKTISDVLNENINLIYSGETVGIKIKKFLNKENYINSSKQPRKTKYYVSDLPKKFDELGSRFLGYPLKNVQHIIID